MNKQPKNAKNEWRIAVVQRVTAMFAAFHKKADEATFAAFDLGLAGIPIEMIDAGLRVALTSERHFCPNVPEFRRMCVSGADITCEDDAVLAWSIAEQAVSRIGSYRSPDFRDCTINAVIRSLGGWIHFCSQSEIDFDTFTRPQFLKTYASMARGGIAPGAGAPLTGFHDRANVPSGHEPQKRITVDCGRLNSNQNNRLASGRAPTPLLESFSVQKVPDAS